MGAIILTAISPSAKQNQRYTLPRTSQLQSDRLLG
jgi:hypothetical protein